MLVCVGKKLKPPKKKTLMWRSTFNGVCYLILTEFEVDSIRLQTESFPLLFINPSGRTRFRNFEKRTDRENEVSQDIYNISGVK